jgi:Uma2 family endonuclease
MIVELLSPSTRKYDLNDKYKLYEASGVEEYWVVDVRGRDVTVFLMQENGTYAEGMVYTDNVHIPVQTLPGLEIEMAELFQF